MSRMSAPHFVVRFRKLSGSGHDEWETKFAEIEGDFNKLMQQGYALFVNEEQVKELSEVEYLWEALGAPEEVVVYAVPALRGGAN